MKLRFALLAAILVVGCTESVEELPPPEEPLLPGGYVAVTDMDRSDPGHFTVGDSADVVRFTTGPAGVAWRPDDVVAGAGDVLVEGTLRLYGAPVAYREAYGIFVGGRGLESARPAYTYFLVRATGDFTIRARRGDVVETLVDWARHMSVERVAEDGQEPVNTLGILRRGDQVDFMVNGIRVFSTDASEVDTGGLAGVRINHRLDVGLTAWSVGPPPPVAADSTSGT